jgi:hypothetical protein
MMQANLTGAAKTTRADNIRRLAEMGLLRDQYNRKLVLADLVDIEFKLKSRNKEEDQ